jgi:hypothetical protein
MSAPRSVRFDEDVLARLDRFVRENPGASASSVANMFVDESLRAHEHPGIGFRPGPTGRRAAIAGGPDVWEVIAALHADESAELDGETAVTGLAVEQVRVALRYYAAYPEEIEERIAANTEAADREERLWRAERRLLEGHR